jgi:hypothetical protein
MVVRCSEQDHMMFSFPRVQRRMLGLPLLLVLLLGTGAATADQSHDHYNHFPRSSLTALSDSPLVNLRGGGGKAAVKKPQSFLKETQKKAHAAITKQTVQTFSWSDHYEAVKGFLILTGLERTINKIFVEYGIAFPAQLAGCIGLFFVMILTEILKPGMGVSIYQFFVPGSNLLAKWFPVLFVPGLVMLPLAPSIGNGWEVRVSSF